MDPFSTLPHELLSSISEDAADWVGLDSLIRVSPRIAALFHPEGGSNQAHSDAIYLVENILRTNPMMSHQLHRFFRMCGDLQSLPFSSGCNLTLAEFMAQGYSSPLSPTSVTGTVLRGMVWVAANIQRLACACLTTFLARTRAVQPIGYGRDAARRLKGEEPYPPREAGPPSWAEEYRVYRALWHLQLYSDVWKVVPQIGWSLSELHLYLRVSDFDIPSERPERGPTQDGEPTGDEMRAVSECLQDICPHPNLSEPLSANLDSFYLRFWLELPDALSLRRQDPQGSDDSQAIAFRSFGVWCPPPLPSPEEDTCKPVLGQWGNTICAVQERNIGYPAEGEDANYSGLCSFTCNYGYCPEGACATVSSPLTIPSSSPFTPSACVAGTGEGNLGGLCSYACNFGYCPIHSCTCTAEGVLIDAPAANSSLTGVPVSTVDYNQYHGLCDFACSRGYCPDGACELRSTLDPSTGSTGHDSSSSSSTSNISNDTIAFVGSGVWEDPFADCPFPCTIIFPETTLGSPTIIYPPPYTTTLQVEWQDSSVTTQTDGEVSTVATTTRVAESTTVDIPPIQVTGWGFWPVVVNGPTDSHITVHPTPRLPPSTVIIADDPNPLGQSSVTHAPRPRTVIIPPYPWDTRPYGKDGSDDNLIVPKPPAITVADGPVSPKCTNDCGKLCSDRFCGCTWACRGTGFTYSDVDTDDDNNGGSKTDDGSSSPGKGSNSNDNPDGDDDDDDDDDGGIDFGWGGIDINGNSPDPNANNEDSNKSQTSKTTSTSTCTRKTITDAWVSCTSLDSSSTSCTTTSTLVEVGCSVTATTTTTTATGESCPFVNPSDDQGSDGGALADSAWSSIAGQSSGWYTYLGYTADPAKTATTTTARKTSTSTTTTATATAAGSTSTNTKLPTYGDKSAWALFLREEVGNNKHTYIYQGLDYEYVGLAQSNCPRDTTWSRSVMTGTRKPTSLTGITVFGDTCSLTADYANVDPTKDQKVGTLSCNKYADATCKYEETSGTCETGQITGTHILSCYW
ncbi:uncharacterized protein BO66DRAFT_436204 [Aspergillus aculeatinus CBS 121060]|uniref:Uncharacterized protein n=1 Tax=Aspergillus aculeatinus CBS 121060 TaxID=1448322 RepID=A0ACD1HG34_9EURO|nr:hypothetical protein BO66DRAFT_436204 [Aspergillus aculeatinus CBS 121060]RAH72535.1 hypothetical protein BO66DRAFT_436204 [Aspergillus aculeatinus CBS 121060]